MRFAYADPPYMGQAKRHYGKHPDYAGEVDHVELIARLELEFDGWALSASMKSIPTIAEALQKDVLTLSWIKPIAPPLGDHRRYTWEPVFLRALRPPRSSTPTHLVASPPMWTFREKPASHVIGEKPEAFCHWVFESAGLRHDDEFVDLFPGSGAVARYWDRWRDQWWETPHA